MSEHPNATIARSAYDAIAKGDATALAAFLDDDVVWHESTPGLAGDYHGRGEVMAMFGRVMSQLEGMEISLHDVLANDDHVVVLHEDTASRDGRTIRSRFVDVYHVRNRTATEHWHLAVDPLAEAAFWEG